MKLVYYSLIVFALILLFFPVSFVTDTLGPHKGFAQKKIENTRAPASVPEQSEESATKIEWHKRHPRDDK